MAFRIQPHMRLHEWVADEAGFFRPYTAEMYLRTYRWMQTWQLVDAEVAAAHYDEAVLA